MKSEFSLRCDQDFTYVAVLIASFLLTMDRIHTHQQFLVFHYQYLLSKSRPNLPSIIIVPFLMGNNDIVGNDEIEILCSP